MQQEMILSNNDLNDNRYCCGLCLFRLFAKDPGLNLLLLILVLLLGLSCLDDARAPPLDEQITAMVLDVLAAGMDPRSKTGGGGRASNKD